MTTTEHWTTVALLVLALVAIVPVGASLDGGSFRRLSVLGALAALTFLLPPGAPAALVCLPWVVGVAQHALGHPSVAALWPIAAGGWLLAHRLVIDPAHVGRSITLLTVAHFLVAGFGLTMLMTVVGRHGAASGATRPMTPLWIHQAGMATVATGILVGGPLEPIGAALLVTALAVHSRAAWRAARSLPCARWMLRISCVAWLSPMAFAGAWSMRAHLPRPAVTSLQTMLTHHAAVNALAVVLAGLVAWVIGAPIQVPAPPPYRTPWRTETLVLTVRTPTDEALTRLVEDWRDRPFSYPIGLLDRPDDQRRWFVDRYDIVVGHGNADFDATCEKLRGWVKFQQTWTKPAFPLAPLEVDVTVGYSARVLGLWWSYCCRIVSVLDDESDTQRRYGFTYGTLAGHAECGEEQFLVTHDLVSDEVHFGLVAVSRPGRWFTWCGLPVARWAQRRFRHGAGAVIRTR